MIALSPNGADGAVIALLLTPERDEIVPGPVVRVDSNVRCGPVYPTMQGFPHLRLALMTARSKRGAVPAYWKHHSDSRNF